MGMFDYVNIKEENTLGIPVGEYQTKELDCTLDNYDLDSTLQFKDSKGNNINYNGCMRLLNRNTDEEVYVYVTYGMIALVSNKKGFHSYDLSHLSVDALLPKGKAIFAHAGDDYQAAIAKRLPDPAMVKANLQMTVAEMVLDKANKDLVETRFGLAVDQIPDTYEDGIVVSRQTLHKINSMEFNKITVKITSLALIKYDKKSRTYKLNKTSLSTKLGRRLKRRIKCSIGIDIMFTITDLSPWCQTPIVEVKYPDIGM